VYLPEHWETIFPLFECYCLVFTDIQTVGSYISIVLFDIPVYLHPSSSSSYSQTCWGRLEMKPIGFHFHKKSYIFMLACYANTTPSLFSWFGTGIFTYISQQFIYLALKSINLELEIPENHNTKISCAHSNWAKQLFSNVC
jgi:hypothetical protein